MGKKIMVCDDDQGILEMMELMLEEYGYQVLIESKSVNVLKHLETHKPDLLLLDIWMPVLSGDQVMKTIKAEPSLLSLPVIMYSASAEGKAIAEKSGADDYIAKPFDMDDLDAKIAALL